MTKTTTRNEAAAAGRGDLRRDPLATNYYEPEDVAAIAKCFAIAEMVGAKPRTARERQRLAQIKRRLFRSEHSAATLGTGYVAGCYCPHCKEARSENL